MRYPSQNEIENPLLEYIYINGGDVASSSCYLPLAEHFKLTKTQINSPLSSKDKRNKWQNIVQWARLNLVNHGYLFNAKVSGIGRWKLTEQGIKKAEALKNKLDGYLATIYPDDVNNAMEIFEGAVKSVTVNIYERSTAAREKCINHYGYSCQICDFNFQDKYGDIGKNFIHVHHTIPISSIKKTYIVDPIADLIPVCPNCHSMIHSKYPPLSIKELKSILKK